MKLWQIKTGVTVTAEMFAYDVKCSVLNNFFLAGFENEKFVLISYIPVNQVFES